MESDAASEAATEESPFPGSSLGIDGSNVNDQQIVVDPKRPVAITAYVLSPKRFHCVFIFVSRCLSSSVVALRLSSTDDRPAVSFAKPGRSDVIVPSQLVDGVHDVDERVSTKSDRSQGFVRVTYGRWKPRSTVLKVFYSRSAARSRIA